MLYIAFKMNGNMDSISRDRDGMVQAGEWNKNKFRMLNRTVRGDEIGMQKNRTVVKAGFFFFYQAQPLLLSIPY